MSEINAPPTSEAIATLARETATKGVSFALAAADDKTDAVEWAQTLIRELEPYIASALASVAQERETEIAELRNDWLEAHMEPCAKCGTKIGGEPMYCNECAEDKSEAECERLRAELAQAKTESESRRQTLLTVREQQVSDWKRAEKAESELAQARYALNLIADPPGSAEGICECEHDTGDCCAETSYHCPQCIAAKALRLRDLQPLPQTACPTCGRELAGHGAYAVCLPCGYERRVR